jgi:ribose 5-phosphate isomerase B
MKVYIASDHGGFELKEFLKKHFVEVGIEHVDMGPFELDPHDDYTDLAIPLAEKVSSDKEGMGILACRNGIGVCVVANKVKGIRAALSWSSFHAQSTRNDDNSNVLCLPADYIDNEKALEIVGTWLSTPFSGEDRHIRRINKIIKYEKR